MQSSSIFANQCSLVNIYYNVKANDKLSKLSKSFETHASYSVYIPHLNKN